MLIFSRMEEKPSALQLIVAGPTPQSLCFMVIAIAAWWYAVPQMARLVYAGAQCDAEVAVRWSAAKLVTP